MLIIHSLLRWALLLLLIAVVFKSYVGWKQKKEFSKQDNLISLLLMIAADLQLLFGIGLYFMSDMMKAIRTLMSTNMGEVMKNSTMRFWAIEHVVAMVIAIAFIHIGRILSKKASTDELKHKKSFIWMLLALIVILLSIPWPFREMGRPLFPF
jgi:membrane protein DedA with SNARE-associated domain